MEAAASTNLRADPDAIEAFLRGSVPIGIHLAWIDPRTGVTGYRHFGDDPCAAANWAAEENMRGRGVYWTVNRVRDGFHGKPKKDDIVEARFAHVDIDPPKDDRPFDKIAVVDRLGTLRLEPSFIIDSGGGLGAFWRLEEPSAYLPAVETINMGLRDLFDADHCWNIDRLMRLPGTVNWPTKQKIAAGRQPRLASIIVEDQGTFFDAGALAGEFPRTGKSPTNRSSADISGPFALLTADDLDLGPLAPLRSLIDHPQGRDRSGDALACAGRMTRDGYSDAQILGVLMNPANAVHAHIGDQRDPRYQALRCIERARSGAEQSATVQHGAEVAAALGVGSKPSQPTERAISATPFVWRDPQDIPLRPWVYGRWLLRNTITAVVAPGGAGKSSLMASTILALATGRGLLGKTVWDGPKRVWYWNLEDDGDELARQIQAAAKHHAIKPDDCDGRLFIDSGLDGAGLCTAIEGRDGFQILRPVIEALVDELVARQMDVLIVDPFVSSHAVSENDNGAIDAVAKEWARVAKRTGCSIVLVHHTRKLGGMKVTAEMARGAVSLIAAARSTLVLNRMEPEEAERFGIEGDDERRRFFNVQDDKANRAPAEKAEWYRIASVDLGNGGLNGLAEGDNVGVVTCWSPPDVFDGMSADTLVRVQMAIAEGQWRESAQSPQWAGYAVADVLKLDPDAKTTKKRVFQMLKVWTQNNALKVVEAADPKSRKVVKFVEVGQWANDGAPPARVERSKVEHPPAKNCSTTTPYGVEGWSGAQNRHQSQVEQNGVLDDEDDPAADAFDAPRTVF